MREIRWLAVLAGVALSIACSNAQPSLKTILCGVWYRIQNPSSEVLTAKEFAWGKGVTVVNGAVEMDTSGKDPTIFLPGMGGPFRITELSWEGKDVFNLSFFFTRGNFQVDYKVHYDSAKETLWFEDLKKSNFIESGPSNLWYKISGPEKK